MYPYDENSDDLKKTETPTDDADTSETRVPEDTAPQSGSDAPEDTGSEYHYIRPEQPSGAWRDASYTTQTDGGSVPPRYYVPEEPKKEKKPKGSRLFLKVAALCLVCALIGGLGGGALAARFLKGDATEATTTSVPVLTAAPTATTTSSSSSSAALSGNDIYTLGCEQAVGITSEVTTTNYFGMPTSASVSGSGFIISEDGYIMTNYHVVEDAYEGGYTVSVMLHDGTSYTAKIVGFDSDNDIAVLKIDATGLSAVTLGNSDSIAVGETVYAIGNPLGELDYTMTSGIVSATDRVITTDESTSINMFQIDAAVNSGNSGGPLYNSAGQVIGVVTAKYSSTGVEGLGFAIPINDAVSVANDIITNGYVTGKPYMGVEIQTVSASAAQYYNMAQGAYVYSITSGSPAETSGLKIGDIITDLDGTTITSADDLSTAVKTHKAGDTVSMTVWRSGETLYLTITFGEETPDTEASQSQTSSGSGSDSGSGSGSSQQPSNPFGSGW